MLKSTCLSFMNQCLWISVPSQNLSFLSYTPPVLDSERQPVAGTAQSLNEKPQHTRMQAHTNILISHFL